MRQAALKSVLHTLRIPLGGQVCVQFRPLQINARYAGFGEGALALLRSQIEYAAIQISVLKRRVAILRQGRVNPGRVEP
jgi:hypothetical protein